MENPAPRLVSSTPSSHARLFRVTLAAALLLAAAGCDESKPAAEAGAAPTGAAATAAAPAAEKAPAAEAVSCKAVIAQIVKLQEAEKKDGIINAKNAEAMEGRCEKANNIKDAGDVVKCVMAATNVETMGACPDMGKLLGPW